MKRPVPGDRQTDPSENIEQKRSHCIRCGTCCRKGGPALHQEDIESIKSGKIPLKSLTTIRKGEPAFDNVKTSVEPATTDIIKIRSRNSSQCCIFLDDTESACRIYENRPMECRTLQCWNTTAIERLYGRNRITRRDLLADTEEIWRLVSDHQKQCSYDTIRILISQRKTEEIRYLIRYDAHLRSLLSEKGRMDPDIMEFLLGNPLSVTIRRLGFIP